MAKAETKTDNLAIWNSVQMTDPQFTKDFDKAGFKGTATNVIWLCKQVTAKFGPTGQGWGWIINEDRVVVDPRNNGDSCWMTKLTVWWKDEEIGRADV